MSQDYGGFYPVVEVKTCITYPSTLNFLSMVRALLICVAVLMCNNVINAQNRSEVDSIDAILAKQQGIDRFGTLINKVRLLAETDFSLALPVIEEAYRVAATHGDSVKMVQAGRMQGQILNRLDKRNEAIEILSTVLPIAERNGSRSDLKLILSNLANAYTFRAEYPEALNLHFKALALNDEDNDKVNAGYSLNNIGLVYYKMKNFSEAINYYQQALEIQMTSSEQFEIGKLWVNIGNCYNGLGEYEKAREQFERGRQACLTDCKSYFELDGNLGLGINWFYAKDYNKALHYFKETLARAYEYGNTRFAAESNYFIGLIMAKKEEWTNSVTYFEAAERIAADESLNELLIQIYDALASVYDQNHDHANFNIYIKKYVALKDQVYNEKVMQSLARSRAEYEQRVNLATIKANEMTIAQQKRLYTAALIIAVLSALLVVVLLLAYRALKGVNRKLSSAQDVIFEQNRKLGIRNEELDRMVEKKTEELKLVNLTLKQMNDELDTFILKSAEDIRAPLASLRGICHVALLDVKDPTSQIYLQKISKTTELLNSILKRLIVLNKINHSKPSLSEIDLHSLVDQVISIQMKKGLPENLVVRKNIIHDAPVHTDKELMSLLLENTIDNALKFCDRSVDKEHFIEINVAPANNGRVNVRVVDNRDVVRNFTGSDIYNIFQGSEFETDGAEAEKQDLYFVKTAAKKIGGKVAVGRTPEGYNELTLVF